MTTTNLPTEQYSQTTWALVLNLLSFNIKFVKKELNSIVDWLVVFAASPTQQLLPPWLDCSFQSLHRPYISENEGFLEAMPNDERICVVIQNEPPIIQSFGKEEIRSTRILGESQKVFSWS
jgi:hypothetical protein